MIYMIYSVLYVQIVFLMTLDCRVNSVSEFDGKPIQVVKPENCVAICFGLHSTGLIRRMKSKRCVDVYTSKDEGVSSPVKASPSGIFSGSAVMM